jgi:hypothetical protein
MVRAPSLFAVFWLRIPYATPVRAGHGHEHEECDGPVHAADLTVICLCRACACQFEIEYAMTAITQRAHLSSCGIEQALQLVPGRALSGGQRSRLALAAVSFLKPHVLVLEYEPYHPPPVRRRPCQQQLLLLLRQNAAPCHVPSPSHHDWVAVGADP